MAKKVEIAEHIAQMKTIGDLWNYVNQKGHKDAKHQKGWVEKFNTFVNWLTSLELEQIREIDVHRNQFNRNDLAKFCGIGKSVFTQNHYVRHALSLWEDECRKPVDGNPPILEPQSDVEAAFSEVQEKSESERHLEARNKSLETQISVLRAENGKLKAELAKFSTISEIFSTTGRLPR